MKCEIDSGIHDASAVGPNGIGDVLDVDGVEKLGVGRAFDENLVIQVVSESAHKDVDCAHNLKNVQALFESLPGQVDIGQFETILFFREISHEPVGFPVGKLNGVEIVESSVEIVCDNVADGDIAIVKAQGSDI